MAEKLFFFVGTHQPAERGGHAAEGEDIDMLDFGIDEALEGSGAAASTMPTHKTRQPDFPPVTDARFAVAARRGRLYMVVNNNT